MICNVSYGIRSRSCARSPACWCLALVWVWRGRARAECKGRFLAARCFSSGAFWLHIGQLSSAGALPAARAHHSLISTLETGQDTSLLYTPATLSLLYHPSRSLSLILSLSFCLSLSLSLFLHTVHLYQTICSPFTHRLAHTHYPSP